MYIADVFTFSYIRFITMLKLGCSHTPHDITNGSREMLALISECSLYLPYHGVLESGASLNLTGYSEMGGQDGWAY